LSYPATIPGSGYQTYADDRVQTNIADLQGILDDRFDDVRYYDSATLPYRLRGLFAIYSDASMVVAEDGTINPWNNNFNNNLYPFTQDTPAKRPIATHYALCL